MGELKSAYDRALERADKLGALSPEELRETKQAEQSAVGKALAERYLEHGYERPLVEALERYQGDDTGVVLRGALSRLVAEVDFDKAEATERALKGIERLLPAAKGLQTGEEIRSLAGQYRDTEREAREQARQRTHARGGRLLEEMGIGGSAIAEVRLGTGTVGKEVSAELRSRFEGRLAELKEQLLALSDGF